MKKNILSVFILISLLCCISVGAQTPTTITNEFGSYPNTDGPVTDTYFTSIAGCTSVVLSYDFTTNGLGWAGTSNMEWVGDCSFSVPCTDNPGDTPSGSCDTCWDYFYIELLIDGSVVYSNLIGDEITDPEILNDEQFSLCTNGSASSATVNIIGQTWAAAENLSYSDLTLVCFNGLGEPDIENPIQVTCDGAIGLPSYNCTNCDATTQWFNAPTGGTVLGTGESFTPPSSDNAQGTYTYYVENTAGCPRTEITMFVGQQPIADLTTNGITSFCEGDAVTINASGSQFTAFADSTIYTYVAFNTLGNILLDSSSQNNIIIIDDLPAGTYSFGVNVSNFQTYTDPTSGSNSITECFDQFNIPTPINIFELPEATAVDTAICGNGSILLDAVPETGTPPYTYNWMASGGGNIVSGATTGSPEIDAEGIYSVTISDVNGCSTTSSINVVSNPLPVAGIAPIPFGFSLTCDIATFDLDASSSTGLGASSQYEWGTTDGNITTPNDQLLVSINAAGTYNLTVTDDFGCTASTFIIIQDNSTPPDLAVAITDASCDGLGNGAVDLSITDNNNAPTYTFDWDNDGTGDNDDMEDLSGLDAGIYNVTVTDNYGCSATTDAEVIGSESPTLFIDAIDIVYNTPTCIGFTASINIGVTPGTGVPPYTFDWDNDGTGDNDDPEDLNGLTAEGTYTVTVTDNNGCTASLSQIIDVAAPPLATASPADVSCNGETDGSIGLTLNGGTSPFIYDWEDSAGNEVGSTQSITGLGADTYTVTVTDDNGCETSLTLPVGEPDAIAIDANYDCSGGGLSISATGGDNNFTFTESGTPVTNGVLLATNIYTLVATDGNGCTASSSLDVNCDPCLGVTITSSVVIGDVLCNGGANGEIDLTPAGGTVPYTFNWEDAANANIAVSEDIVGLVAGSYFVTITDDNGCSGTTSALVNEPLEPLLVAISTTAASCNGFADGSIDVAVTGGTFPYTYNWNNGLPPQEDHTNTVTANTYTLTVTDANGCTTTNSATLNEPDTIAITLNNITNVACFGDSSGAIDIEVTGGTPPFTFDWNNDTFDGQEDITNAPAGTYGLNLTDSNGCTQTFSVDIAAPLIDLTVDTLSTTPVSCGTSNTGEIIIVADGGTSPYTYTWNNAAFNNQTNLTGLNVGTYSVTVTDDNACTTTLSIDLADPGSISATANPTNPLCQNDANGAIDIDVSGGTGTITYNWSNDAFNGQEDINGLTAGTYSLTITDENDCTFELTELLINPDAINIDTTPTAPSCSTLADGSISLNVSGGTIITDYTYLWDDVSLPNSGTLINLEEGTYNVTVFDDNGCSETSSITLIAVDDVPNAPTLINGQTEFCGAASGASFSVETVADATAYNWTVPSGASITAGNGTTNISVDFGSSASGDVCVVAINDCGDSPPICLAVNVNTLPNINDALSEQLVCNNNFDLSGLPLTDANGVVSIPGDLSYFNNNAGVPGSSLASPVVNNSGAYWVVANSANGCTDSLLVSVVLNQAPSAGTAQPAASFCSNDNTLFDVSSLLADQDTDGFWIETSTNTSTSFNPSVATFNPNGQTAGTYTFSYTVLGTAPCPDASTTVTINVLQAPTATVATNSTVCNISAQGSIINFNNLILSGETNGTWEDTDLSGIDLSDLNAVDFNGTTPASYVFTYVLDDGSCTNTFTTEVLVQDCDCPNVATVAPGTALCSDGITSLDLTTLLTPDTETGSWTIDEGTSLNPPLIIGDLLEANNADAGTYTLTYTLAAAPLVDCPDSSIQTITVFNPVSAGEDNIIEICSDITEEVDLFAALLGTPELGGIWLNPSNAAHDGTFNPVLDFSGTYQYIVTADTPCQNDTSSITVALETAPNAGDDNIEVVCPSETAIIDLNSLLNIGDFSGTWYNPSLLEHLTASFDPTIDEFGDYLYVLNGINVCTSDTAIITITQDTGSISAGNDTTVCGFTYQLNASGSGAWLVIGPGTWSFDVENTPTSTITVDQPGLYNLTWVDTSNPLCILQDEVSITFAEPFTFAYATTCAPDNLNYELTVEFFDGSLPYFVNGEVIAGNIYTEVFSSGATFDITLSDNSEVCEEQLSDFADCGCPLITDPLVDNDTLSFCLGQTIPTFTLTELAGISYTWYEDNSGVAGAVVGMGASFTPSTAGNYFVQASDASGCLSQLVSISLIGNETPPAPDVNDLTICAGQPMPTIAGASTTDGVLFWVNAEIGAGETFVPTLTEVGNYIYEIYELSSAGCTGPTAIFNLTIENCSCPTIDNITANEFVCSEEDFTLTANLADITNLHAVEWLNADGDVIGTSTSISISEENFSCENNINTYTLNVYCTNDTTVVAVNETISVTVFPLLDIGFDFINNGCTLVANIPCDDFVVLEGDTISTDIDGDMSAINLTVVNTAIAPLGIDVACDTLNISTNFNCTISECPEITGFTPEISSVCSEETFGFSVEVSNPDDVGAVEWVFNDSFVFDTDFDVELTAQDVTGCEVDSINLSINLYCIDDLVTPWDTELITIYVLPDLDENLLIVDTTCTSLPTLTSTCDNYVISPLDVSLPLPGENTATWTVDYIDGNVCFTQTVAYTYNCSLICTPPAPPTAVIDSLGICEGESFTNFEANTEPDTYIQWFNATGDSLTIGATYTPTDAGTYTATAVSTTDTTCFSSTTPFIASITAPDNAAFDYPATELCLGDDAILPNIIGTAGGTFTASNGITINAATGELTPDVAGTTTITYTTAGICPASTTFELTVNSVDNAAFDYPATELCLGDDAILPNIIGTAGGTFTASNGITINAATGELTPDVVGTTTITYLSTGDCPAVSTFDVTINDCNICIPPASPIATTDSLGFCGDFPTDLILGFTASSEPDTYIQWFNAAGDSIAVGTEYIPTMEGIYTAIAVSDNDTSCVSPAVEFEATATPFGDGSFEYPEQIMCLGDGPFLPIIIGDTGGTFAALESLTINELTGEITPEEAGLFEIQYITAAPCTVTGVYTISVLDTVTTVNAGENISICEGESFTLDGVVEADSLTNVSWSTDIDNGSFADENSLSTIFTPFTSEGSFYIYLNASNFCGNTQQDSILVSIEETVVLSISGDNSITIGESTELTATGGSSYTWVDNVETLSCTDCPNPIATPSTTTTYTVIDESACSEPANFTVVVNAVNENKLIVPNAFSPNNDGINDLFRPAYNGNITSYTLAIFDRWGNEIFTTNDAAQAWDGTFKGVEQEIGVYVYYISYGFDEEEALLEKGNVTLIR